MAQFLPNVPADDTRVTILLGLLVAYAIYRVALITYRLVWDPLAKIPGRKLAAATSLYAFYHDAIRGGKYVWEVRDMHKKYGPIVRIRPNTVHIQDAKFLDQVFGSASNRRDKSSINVNFLQVKDTVITTAAHEHHRRRRQPLSPYFSKQNIRRLEPVVQTALQKFLDMLDTESKLGRPVQIKAILDAATCDIITDYSYSKPWDCMEKPDLNEPFFNLLYTAGRYGHINSYLPFVTTILQSVPESIVKLFDPAISKLGRTQGMMLKEIEGVRKLRSQDTGKTTILDNLLYNDLPESEKSDERVWNEALLLVAAGTETTTRTMTNTIFRVLSNPSIYKKLRAELDEALPDPNEIPTAAQVENLPYLKDANAPQKAVINETLRHDPPVWTRQERSAPTEDLTYTDEQSGKTYFLPKGTVMAMTAPLLNRDSLIYDAPDEYRPERFFEDPHLDRWMLTFSRGPRVCLGMNLAWLEMQMFLASIFRKYDFSDGSKSKKTATIELYETSEKDIEVVEEFASPYYAKGTHGVRVLFKDPIQA